jgi:thymidylate kinase
VLLAELLLSDQLLRSALAGGRSVLYEHHLDSIVAYQAARLIEERGVQKIATAVDRMQKLVGPWRPQALPNATILLYAVPQVAAARASRRDARALTRQEVSFSKMVATAYDTFMPRVSRPVLRCDTTKRPLAELTDEVSEWIESQW